MRARTLQEEIGGLAGLDLISLRGQWLELYGSEASSRMSRELIIQAIAYRLQENIAGGISSASRARITSADGDTKIGRTRIDRNVKAGTRFIREWQGRTIEVVANSSGGYLYLGRTFKSLSAIAREITGTRWSGPAFFGLTRESDHGQA